MDAQLKELAKLEKLVSNASSGKSKKPSIDDSLDSLIRTLQEAKDRLQSGSASRETFTDIASKVDSTKTEVDVRQKEIYNSLVRLNKAMDKVSDIGSSTSNLPHGLCRGFSAAAIISASIHLPGSDPSSREHHCNPFSPHRPIQYRRDIHQRTSFECEGRY